MGIDQHRLAAGTLDRGDVTGERLPRGLLAGRLLGSVGGHQDAWAAGHRPMISAQRNSLTRVEGPSYAAGQPGPAAYPPEPADPFPDGERTIGVGERRSHVTVDQSQAASDQIAQDDAHLESLGIKPELRRTLGFLSNFAIAFAFISVSTGSFGNFGVGIGLSGPVFFWTWFVVIFGQLLVALNFAELSSHFPVAGSIYQWSKRLSNRTLGWFTGW